jgi:hypothetical protein
MNFPWFRRVGLFYIPKTTMGWIILLAGFAFAVYSFIDIDSRSHSGSDTLINFVFMLLIIGAVYTTIGYISDQVHKK